MGKRIGQFYFPWEDRPSPPSNEELEKWNDNTEIVNLIHDALSLRLPNSEAQLQALKQDIREVEVKKELLAADKAAYEKSLQDFGLLPKPKASNPAPSQPPVEKSLCEKCGHRSDFASTVCVDPGVEGKSFFAYYNNDLKTTGKLYIAERQSPISGSNRGITRIHEEELSGKNTAMVFSSLEEWISFYKSRNLAQCYALEICGED